jgi:integral membrane sensor domain MASE1
VPVITPSTSSLPLCPPPLLPHGWCHSRACRAPPTTQAVVGVVLGLLLVPSPPLAHVALRGSLPRCRLHLPSIVRIVVVGVLLGVGRTAVLLVEMSLAFVKLKEKKLRATALPALLVGPPHLRFRRRCCLDPDLVVAVVPVVAAPRVTVVPVPVRYA